PADPSGHAVRPRRPLEPLALDRPGAVAGRRASDAGPGVRARGPDRLHRGRHLLRGLSHSPGLRDELPPPRGARPHRPLLGAGAVRAAGTGGGAAGHERGRVVLRVREDVVLATWGAHSGPGRPGVRLVAGLLAVRPGPRG